MKIFSKIMAVTMALTLIFPFLLCWILSTSNDIYVQPDEIQSYSDLFYECSENDGLLYDFCLRFLFLTRHSERFRQIRLIHFSTKISTNKVEYVSYNINANATTKQIGVYQHGKERKLKGHGS